MVKILSVIQIMQQRVNEEKNAFKKKAFLKVINQLSVEEYKDKSIQSLDDIKDITGIGASMKKTIQEIIEGKMVVDVEKEKKSKAIQEFMTIMSVGSVKAASLVNDHNITSIKELKQNTDLLNNKQAIGLKYFEDFNMKIPREEMKVHHAVIEKCLRDIDNKIQFDIVGSYRRGKEESGDIDVLITHPNGKNMLAEIVNSLKTQNYITDDFAFGKQKYMGACKVCSIFRRLDILFIEPMQYPFAIMYFTGSKIFNIKMRKIALDKGYSLSEHGFKKNAKDTVFVDLNISNEKDIFKFLSMEYVEPFDR
jgi:DNA polymerase beta